MSWYAGIGSREAAQRVCDGLAEVAQALGWYGWVLRSGGARGVDRAFELAANDKEILLPSKTTKEAIEMASKHHPAWDRCDGSARRLHGRNAQIILGRDLVTPVSFVLFWTQAPRGRGGTWLGVRIAEAHGIQTLNLATIEQIHWLATVRELEETHR